MIQLPLPGAGDVGNAAVRVAGVIHGLKVGLVVLVMGKRVQADRSSDAYIRVKSPRGDNPPFFFAFFWKKLILKSFGTYRE